MISINQKRDAELFRRRLAVLQQRSRLGARRWWPYYLYHFADITNVVSILKAGEVVSRATLMAEQGGFTDSASPVIIDQTDEKWKNYVRFYFRPRTPTLYRNEGFRPLKRRALGGAHCPAPVYMFFDIEQILTREDSAFSYGSLARPETLVYSTAAEFELLPFDLVYHDSRFEKDERDSIIFHRHAEVIVPERVGLESLRYLWCRSEAEYETLRQLLPAEVLAAWGDKIGVRSDYTLFNRDWLYVERAALDAERILFTFNPPRSSMDAGPFDLRVKVIEGVTGSIYNYRQTDAEITKPLAVDLSALRRPLEYHVTLYLDGNIAYAGEFIADHKPF